MRARPASQQPLPADMITGALQVAAGGQPLLLTRRGQQRRRVFRPPQAVASDAAAAATANEEGGKVALGGSGVAVTKLGVGAWSWGDTTYWNEFQWDGTYVCVLLLGSGSRTQIFFLYS